MLYKFLIFIISILYLCLEFSFNTDLVNAVSTNLSVEKIQGLEETGRALSGLGATLIAWQITLKYLGKITLRGMLFSALLIFPATYYGVEKAIDYFVENTSGEQRIQSKYINGLKYGVIEGIVDIKDLPYNRENENSVDKVFVSTFGPLLVLSPNILDTLTSDREFIVKKAMQHLTQGNINERYDNYINIFESVNSDYDKYWKNSEDFSFLKNGIPSKVQETWVLINNDLFSSYSKFEEKRKIYEDHINNRLGEFTENINKYVETRNSCPPVSPCFNITLRMNKNIQDKFPNTSPDIDFWCVKTYMNEYDLSMCETDDETIKNRLINLIYKEFELESGGYSIDILSIKEYVLSPASGRKISDILRDKHNVDLNDNWTIEDKNKFEKALTRGLNKAYLEQWNLKGGGVPPGLTRSQFIQHDKIQRSINRLLGSNYNIRIDHNWPQNQFKKYFIDVLIENKMEDELEKLSEGEIAFRNGGAYEKEGISEVRALFVPTIAIALSLFFALLNLGLICTTLVSFGFKLGGLGEKNMVRVSRTMKVVIILSILLVPLILEKNRISQSPTYSKFIDSAREESMLLTYGFEWLIQIQPIFYHLGSNINSYSLKIIVYIINK